MYHATIIPVAGDIVTVDLPGEKLRATVVRMIDDDTLLAEITGTPFMRSHMFRAGDIIACRRSYSVLGETWKAEDDRAHFNFVAAEPPPPAKRQKKVKPNATAIKRLA